ncbi:hypothetical protein G9H61_11635 [Aquirufa ecclesiirivi]|uniref:Uncharacterized protein n=1 Tax=Aquirufa ecclesiirivi TaxID=2715124 RepID=A0ABT4JIL1_9BACT|nr:hypothetical protein [Aquirufa ecclesiirivi]MCZ2476102.1 hypothetical protein [Aquirufa ecclesiirivi]
MPEITISCPCLILNFQHLSIKKARTQEIFSNNLEKQDTFHLPPGNHIIEIVFRFNIFQYPPSRILIDVPEGKQVYFDLTEKDVAHYLIAQLFCLFILSIGFVNGITVACVYLKGIFTVYGQDPLFSVHSYNYITKSV